MSWITVTIGDLNDVINDRYMHLMYQLIKDERSSSMIRDEQRQNQNKRDEWIKSKYWTRVYVRRDPVFYEER